MTHFADLKGICGGEVILPGQNREVRFLITDSRKAVIHETSLFFAIPGPRHDGHRYIEELYTAGIRQFVVEKEIPTASLKEANILLVKSSISALQNLAAFHRKQFHLPVIGITGSNGKTIIKEWLFQLLSPEYNTVKNPGSYNSQIGVPLSVWQIQSHHQLGIFEAGISNPGEMERLQEIMQPTLGIFTNVGTAHDEGFTSRTEKIHEKLKLFSQTTTLIYCADHQDIDDIARTSHHPTLSWSASPATPADVRIITKGQEAEVIHHSRFHLHLPFSNKASVENSAHCITLMLHLGYTPEVIQERITLLKAIPMRLELKQGINRCQVIDDTYNNDLAGLQISLDFLAGLPKKKRTVILSDMLQSGMPAHTLTKNILTLIQKGGITSFIGIGPMLSAHATDFRSSAIITAFYESTAKFLEQVAWDQFENELILVKGARLFQFEKIVQHLQRKIHGTVMEIDLNKVIHNLNFFKARLKPGVKIMVMVKAFAYGSGSEEVATLLQYHQVDYLGVAYADEGVELRKNQISLPIMVMNPTEENFEALVAHQLEPVIYNLKMLKGLADFLQGHPCKLHLEVDTGMHRLGFGHPDLPEAIALLKSAPGLSIASVYSHLAGADDPVHDAFSRQQVNLFEAFYRQLTESLQVNPLRHILNSPGIIRFPEFQMDMVRLGIGLYGINPTEEKLEQLQPVATLKTIISQIRKIAPGETIGYGRKGTAKSEMTLATLAIGYADGFSRSFSLGKGAMLVHGKRAPVVGNVCMDMTMIDITGVEAREGDEVIVFGDQLSIQEVAARIDTIPYEILTNTSERVKRIYVAESI